MIFSFWVVFSKKFHTIAFGLNYNMLKINNLQAGIKWKKILNWVNLKVWAWELHVILWPNWSWKSTLWKILLAHPKFEILSWDINFNWKNIDKLKTYERAKKWIFLSHQHPIMVEWVSTFELIRAAQKETWEHIGLIKFKKQVKQHFENSHLNKEFLERDLNKWTSWWEAKKIEIASLLSLDNFSLAFLDEIDSGLDFDALNVIVNWINSFLSSWKKSIILVTHSKQILSKLKPDYIHVFCDWKIIKSGWIQLFDEINQKWYSWFSTADKCNTCEKSEDCKIH